MRCNEATNVLKRTNHGEKEKVDLILLSNYPVYNLGKASFLRTISLSIAL